VIDANWCWSNVDRNPNPREASSGRFLKMRGLGSHEG
jgi:hypothetical protein